MSSWANARGWGGPRLDTAWRNGPGAQARFAPAGGTVGLDASDEEVQVPLGVLGESPIPAASGGEASKQERKAVAQALAKQTTTIPTIPKETLKNIRNAAPRALQAFETAVIGLRSQCVLCSARIVPARHSASVF